MKKTIKAILIAVCVLVPSVQVFGKTENNIGYINEMKINDVGSTQFIIDNANFDLKPGQYFGISLENAEFDLDDNKYPIAMSEHFEFEGSGKKWLSLKVKDNVTEGGRLSFSFYSKLKGEEAKLIIDPEDSGITGGTYVYATTGKGGNSTKGKIDTIKTTSLNDELRLAPIVIREGASSAFRSVQMDNTDKKPLVTIQADKDLFRLRSSQSHNPITFVVDDGDDHEKRYKLGQDYEVKLDVDNNKIIFQEDNDEIFSTVGHNYTVTVENMSVFPVKGSLRSDNLKLEFDGELLGKQLINLGNSTENTLKLETSTDDLKPATKQKIKFSIDEGVGSTLFKEGYIYLGLYGGATIDSKSDIAFTLKEGVNTYTEKETKAFKVELDPIGDRIMIKDYNRQGERSPIKIEGTLDLTIPEEITNDIEFFISEPSLSKASVKTVLLGTDKAKPVEPADPEEPEEPEKPVDPSKPQVSFQIDNQTYTVGGVNYLLDMKPYISSHERIMVPFRYVAYALGVDEDDLKWNNAAKTITLEGDKPMTINLITGKMLVDGETSSLSETRLLNGRTFVPVGEIGRAFGVSVNWDSETRTATFN